MKSAQELDRCETVAQMYITSALSAAALSAKAVLFMGSYAYRPNKEGIDFLVQEVFPELVRLCPRAQLVVVGGDVPYQRPWLINPGLLPAEELPAIIRAVAVSVAPIFSGSGTRLKIAESLVAGTPVLATSKGKEGLPLRRENDIPAVDNSKDFVERLSIILRDGGNAEREAQRAVMEELQSVTTDVKLTPWRRGKIAPPGRQWRLFGRGDVDPGAVSGNQSVGPSGHEH